MKLTEMRIPMFDEVESLAYFGEEASDAIWSSQQVFAEFERETSIVYVAYLNQARCGLAIVMAAAVEQSSEALDLDPKIDADLLLIAIHPDFRRRGLGADFLCRLKKQLAIKRIGRLVLEVRANNIPAINLYRLCGFETVGNRSGYYEDGKVDGLVMACELSDC